MRKLFLLQIFISSWMLISCGGSEPEDTNLLEKNNKQYIILKADNVRRFPYVEESIHENWKRFIAFSVVNNIKIGIGIVAKSLETKDENYIKELKVIKDIGTIEIWLHAYDHIKFEDGRKEFCGTDYEFQKEHIQKSIQLGKEKLGITFTTFGAPFNCIDDNTLQVINETEEIKVWLFGDKRSSKFVIARTNPSIEKGKTTNGKWDVDIYYENFIQNYNPDAPYYIFELHPKEWDEQDWNNFEIVIGFLKKQNVEFVTPYEYYLIKTGKINNE